MKWRRRSPWPWAVWHVGERRNVPIIEMMNLANLVQSLRCSLLHIESRLLQAAGLTLDRHLGELTGSGRYVSYVNHHWTDRAKKVTVFFNGAAPALAVNAPSLLPQLQPQVDEDRELEEQQSPEQPPGLLDSILWMAAPKKRRTIEVNRTRRRSESKLLKVKVRWTEPSSASTRTQQWLMCTDWLGKL